MPSKLYLRFVSPKTNLYVHTYILQTQLHEMSLNKCNESFREREGEMIKLAAGLLKFGQLSKSDLKVCGKAKSVGKIVFLFVCVNKCKKKKTLLSFFFLSFFISPSRRN